VDAVLKETPAFAQAAKVVFPETRDLAYNVRPLRYFQEINDRNMAQVWADPGVPVLALVGEFELRTAAFDHEYLAEIVDARHPGRGT
jgi:hypothetical protein